MHTDSNAPNISAFPTRDSSVQMLQPIVIVDDSSDDRMLLSRYLRVLLPENQALVCLRSGKELLEYLAQVEMENIEANEFEVEIPSMIFLDLMMPGMDGVDTLIAMRRQPIWADVAVTLITCSRNDVAVKRAEKAGANAFMPKPFSERDVIQALHKDSNYSPTIF